MPADVSGRCWAGREAPALAAGDPTTATYQQTSAAGAELAEAPALATARPTTATYEQMSAAGAELAERHRR